MSASITFGAVEKREIEVLPAISHISENSGLVWNFCAMAAIWAVSDNEKRLIEAVCDDFILPTWIKMPVLACNVRKKNRKHLIGG